MTENNTAEAPTPMTVAAQVAAKTFTQAEVNEIVQNRLKNATRELESLRAAGGAVTEVPVVESPEERLSKLRDGIAAEFGFGAEDSEILLTGTDEATLRMQAERMLSHGFGEQGMLLRGNRAPREGQLVQGDSGSSNAREMREFTNELFGNDPY